MNPLYKMRQSFPHVVGASRSPKLAWGRRLEAGCENRRMHGFARLVGGNWLDGGNLGGQLDLQSTSDDDRAGCQHLAGMIGIFNRVREIEVVLDEGLVHILLVVQRRTRCAPHEVFAEFLPRRIAMMKKSKLLDLELLPTIPLPRDDVTCPRLVVVVVRMYIGDDIELLVHLGPEDLVLVLSSF